jgi:hypothetical protein
MVCAARLRVLLHSLQGGRTRIVTPTMDGTEDTVTQRFGPPGGAQGDASLAFVAFVFRHAGCGGELSELRLGEDLLACQCPQCDETRTFGMAAPRT